jgi:hypothetical protein
MRCSSASSCQPPSRGCSHPVSTALVPAYIEAHAVTGTARPAPGRNGPHVGRDGGRRRKRCC